MSFSLQNLSLQNLSERERRMVLFGGIAAVLVVIFGVLMPLQSSVSKAQERIGKKQADLQWMQSVGPELAAAGPTVARPSTQESLLVVVDRAAREAGLGSSLTSSEPQGPGLLRVRLEKAPFDLMLGWLARLAEQNGITIDSANVDSAGAPGVVTASLVLRLK
jgi:type II secretory pathway component PulM